MSHKPILYWIIFWIIWPLNSTIFSLKLPITFAHRSEWLVNESRSLFNCGIRWTKALYSWTVFFECRSSKAAFKFRSRWEMILAECLICRSLISSKRAFLKILYNVFNSTTKNTIYQCFELTSCERWIVFDFSFSPSAGMVTLFHLASSFASRRAL